jgi:hypothetical protein
MVKNDRCSEPKVVNYYGSWVDFVFGRPHVFTWLMLIILSNTFVVYSIDVIPCMAFAFL